jgi:hypothetical protein
MPSTDALATLGDEIVAQEEVVDRGTRRQGQLGPMALEEPDDLLGSVVLVGPPDVEDGLDHMGRSGPGGVPGPRGPVQQAGRALQLPAFEPLVPGGPTDPVTPAEGAEALQAALRFDDKASTFVHDMGLLERHRSPPVRCRL